MSSLSQNTLYFSILCVVCTFILSVGFGAYSSTGSDTHLADIEAEAGEENHMHAVHEHIVKYYSDVEDERRPDVAQDWPEVRQKYTKKIAIIIDDMGLDRRRGARLIEIEQPLTLAFLPYAEGLESMTSLAHESGHELMIHMPMQPENTDLDLGHIHLKGDMSHDDMTASLERAFRSFDGYVGLNNHMGSRLTQNREAMEHVLEVIKERGLYFIDSKTISTSVAQDIAHEKGLRSAGRDVFLDHEDSPEFVAKALRLLERTAERKGYAIAIGHPKDATINGLINWIPSLKSKGIELVHVSEILDNRHIWLRLAQKRDKENENGSQLSGLYQLQVQQP